MRGWIPLGLLVAAVGTGAGAGTPVERTARIAKVETSSPAPLDLVSPEGKSRWELSSVLARSEVVRTLAPKGSSITIRESPTTGSTGAAITTRFEDPAGGDAASRWLEPDVAGIARVLGSRERLILDEVRGDLSRRLVIETEIVGIGWLHLPSGPREVILQRAIVARDPWPETGDPRSETLHRWIDPLSGVVAEVTGPSAAEPGKRAALEGAEVVQEVLAGAADLKLYIDDLESLPYDRIDYGWDRGMRTRVSSLTPEAYPTAGDLIAASTWDFSGNTASSTTTISGTTTANNATTINASGSNFSKEIGVGDRIALSSNPGAFAVVNAVNSATQCVVATPLGNGTTQNIILRAREVAASTTPVNAAETCNYSQCGYTSAGGNLLRRDVRFDSVGGVDKFNSIEVREDRAADVTIWLRAGAQKEGKNGAFGTGESRFCYDPATGRTPVPVWQLRHQDAGGWFLQAGDHWEAGPFNCEQNIFNTVCGNPGFPSNLYSKACGTHTGKQLGDALKGGVVTLPSGHTLNALLVRTVADFCVYTGSICFLPTDEVRTVVYLWQVPKLGTVARIQSQQNAADYTSFTELDEAYFKFGLYPPRSITVTGRTDTSLSLSWDPGLDTHRIEAYRTYWDTDSGGATGYAFDSISNPGQVSFSGPTATISGLQPGTSHYLTVTSRSTYTDPSSSIATTYESLLYPTQVSGDPSFVYPVEVMATTTCTPVAEVQNLRMGKEAGGIQICWDAVTDPCLQGYDILGADSPSSADNFTTIAQVGATTCWVGNPTQRFFLVVARGTDATGPWGHYGR